MSQRPFTFTLTRGLSPRSVKSQRWICVARACSAKRHSLAFASVSCEVVPTFAFPSRANSPRTPGSFPVISRNRSASDTFSQCRRTCAGCSRAEVPATSPTTSIVPVDCSTTPLRHGCASSRNRQRPGETCSTLPETLIKANGRFSSPCLKLIRPSSNSIFSRWCVDSERFGWLGPGEAPVDFVWAGGSQPSRFHWPAALRTRIKLGRVKDMVPN